ncbi:MAG TPA: aldehyde ferredoxin oxidoreductase C-terminal domain-containing protein [Anaerolineaceae bacterium]|nr:aldehyde ferredoxin oxidoreductase C-terminal domain-containing protein [Anaerolineaceae bacterium]HPN50492.1 aldehyde ferredoxin oxidoreductase C-terminal domain-containing protein [Anaerolineaceae bacterium]
MWFIRVNMTDRTAKVEEAPAAYKHLAGRALTSTVVAEEVPPQAHALGPNNKLVFSTGFTTGTSAPTSSRLSIGGKSPLTGGIKEANAGTPWARDLAVMRIRAVIIEGQPAEQDKWWCISISMKDGKPAVEFYDATEYAGAGKSLYDVYPAMQAKLPEGANLGGIGVAGELGYPNSGIVFNDMHGRPSRYAGRGGLGAVLGSKRVKFISILSTGAPGVEIVDKALFEEGRKKMIEGLRSHAITKPKGGLNSYGTAVLINILNEAGGLPTRNFSSGRFEGAPRIAGEAIFESNKTRMGKEVYNHACSPGCIIQCSNTVYAKDGSEITSCVEYESDWSLGANCGIDDLDAIAHMNTLCNAYGLDTIEAGVTIGVAMQAGVIPFGDKEGAINLLHEMGKGTPLGRILGAGAAVTAKVYGVVRAPVVKGQAMPAYEPRAVKGIGITYATSTMGADHTAGYTICPEILGVMGKQDPLSPEGKAALSRAFQATTAFIDSSGHCLFIAFAILDIPSAYQGMIDEANGVLGTHWVAEDVIKYGSEVLRKERAFNEAAGIGKEADRVPEFMKTEPLPPHNQVFDVPDSALDSVYGDL